MRLRNLKLAWRLLAGEPLYSAVACAGVGLAALAGCARQAVAAMRVSPALALRDQ